MSLKLWYDNIDINNFHCLFCDNDLCIETTVFNNTIAYKCSTCSSSYFLYQFRDNKSLMYFDFSNDQYIFRHFSGEMVVYYKDNGRFFMSCPLKEPFQIIISPQNCEKKLPYLLTYS